jgi:hypothetical protein
MMLMMIESKQQLAAGTGMCVRVKQKKRRWAKMQKLVLIFILN